MITDQESTDITLFVRTAGENVTRWNRQRIVETLIREANLDAETADVISKDVEKQIMASGICLLTASLIRELVDAKLIERGLENARLMHARLGFPLYDVRQLLVLQNKENANLPHSPEGTNLILAEGIKRDYALHDVFSSDVGNAHAAGDIHLHGLGYIDRPYSIFQSLEYIKKFGLVLPHSLTVAKPARHPEVLLAHMVRFGAMLQGNCAGVVAWDAINIFFAPHLAGMDEREIEQFSQMMIYEFSQLTAARGGQSMFTDIHLYWEVPEHYAHVPAIGPGGEYTGKNYIHYQDEAQKFARAIFNVLLKGDGAGKPFIFPRPLVHITPAFFHTQGHEEFLRLVCEVAAQKGSPCLVFEREGEATFYERAMNVAQEVFLAEAKTPWKVRFQTLQNVTLNLPRLGYKADRDDKKLFSMLGDLVELAVNAHLQKREFIKKLLAQGKKGPLALMVMDVGGTPYLRMDRTTCLIGMAGLNELVHIHRGKQLHETDEAREFGLKIVGYIKDQSEKLGRKLKMPLVLEQTPAEITSYRLAKLDLKYYSPEAGHFLRGDFARGEIYYSNSSQLSVAAPVDALQRATIEGRFHPLFGAGAMTQIWLDENSPPGEVLAKLVTRIFRETANRQLAFSPEFTTCSACGATSQGLQKTCPNCGSADIDGIARISQYFSLVSGWNKGKLAELRDRRREKFNL